MIQLDFWRYIIDQKIKDLLNEKKENKPKYRINLSHNNFAEMFDFPVLPESLEVKKTGRGASFDIIGLGEVNVIHSRQLAEVSFEGVFPAIPAHYLTIDSQHWKEPSYYVSTINRWQESRRPSRLLVHTEGYKFSIAVSIEQFDRREVAGSGGDIEFKLTLKEYRFHLTRKAVVVQKEGEEAVAKQDKQPRPDERVPPATYTLKKGDSLWSVARTQLKDEQRYKEIMKLNSIRADQLRKLPIGMVLKLPITPEGRKTGAT
ncbi:LysM peptidoglycan-binding domain-containing protein [Paenibacillus sp. SYP-B4298]|uniref:LysM peptidoglycan-binding domain-containing protein n=1 Tax=Paenibacillus sp. SYP-B4298 TaxID=2996034 RepID=UPI0022DD59B5|nr:LysM peptidoglycan-binding domain-containing protein [Paenibacillus sp. SYP-B4298]